MTLTWIFQNHDMYCPLIERAKIYHHFLICFDLDFINILLLWSGWSLAYHRERAGILKQIQDKLKYELFKVIMKVTIYNNSTSPIIWTHGPPRFKRIRCIRSHNELFSFSTQACSKKWCTSTAVAYCLTATWIRTMYM